MMNWKQIYLAAAGVALLIRRHGTRIAGLGWPDNHGASRSGRCFRGGGGGVGEGGVAGAGQGEGQLLSSLHVGETLDATHKTSAFLIAKKIPAQDMMGV